MSTAPSDRLILMKLLQDVSTMIAKPTYRDGNLLRVTSLPTESPRIGWCDVSVCGEANTGERHRQDRRIGARWLGQVADQGHTGTGD